MGDVHSGAMCPDGQCKLFWYKGIFIWITRWRFKIGKINLLLTNWQAHRFAEESDTTIINTIPNENAVSFMLHL